MSVEENIAELRATLNGLNTNFTELKGYMQAGLQHRMDTTARLAVIEKTCTAAEAYQKECTADRSYQRLELSNMKTEVKTSVRIMAAISVIVASVVPTFIEWFKR